MLQHKAVAPGEVRSWELDLEAMERHASWCQRNPGLLTEELEQLHQAFPTFIAALGRPLGDDRCWVEAHEPLTCRGCGELLVFDRGVRCAVCQRPPQLPDNTATSVGLVGRIPALISGRPFCDALDRRMARMARAGHADLPLFQRSIIEANGRRYLAPRYGMWFANSWPHADPPVMVWPEYFTVLDIPPDHVYNADGYYRLCLFAAWREQLACTVLQNRVVPRLLIDLLVADLVAVGQLDTALARLNCSLYEMYNVVGRTEQSDQLARVYEELVGASAQLGG